MSLFRCLRAALAGLAVAVAPLAAAADDSGLNKEGRWTVGRGNASSEVCYASSPSETGALFILRAAEGAVSFGVGTRKPMRLGKRGVLATEAYSLDFEPDFNATADVASLDGMLSESAIAALRRAGELRVTIDGRPVFLADVAGSGLDGALDALIACSNGESGWWGPGLQAAPEAQAGAAEGEAPLNAEGYWSVFPTPDAAGICAASVTVDEEYGFILVADHTGATSLGVGSQQAMRRGRKGRVETDAYRFDFRPGYDGDTYMYARDDLDSQAIFALRRARDVRIVIDGKTLVDMTLEGTGHAAVIDDLAACARGESGWWGAGAAKP